MSKLFEYVNKSYVMEKHYDDTYTIGIQKFKVIILDNRLSSTSNIFFQEINIMRASRNYSPSSNLNKFIQILLNLGKTYHSFLVFVEALKNQYLTLTREHFLKCFNSMIGLPDL